MTGIRYSDSRRLPRDEVLDLYTANAWSSADKPATLMAALENSHTLITAWCGDRLTGLGNAISDGHLVVYYPHLLVHPYFQKQGIGTEILRRLQTRYEGFHQHMLAADHKAVGFYQKAGFVKAGKIQAMWIYAGQDH